MINKSFIWFYVVLSCCFLPSDEPHRYLLGYMPEQSKIYLIDKELNVTPYTLHLALIEYQSAIMRKDFPTAETFFGQLPECLSCKQATVVRELL